MIKRKAIKVHRPDRALSTEEYNMSKMSVIKIKKSLWYGLKLVPRNWYIGEVIEIHILSNMINISILIRSIM